MCDPRSKNRQIDPENRMRGVFPSRVPVPVVNDAEAALMQEWAMACETAVSRRTLEDLLGVFERC